MFNEETPKVWTGCTTFIISKERLTKNSKGLETSREKMLHSTQSKFCTGPALINYLTLRIGNKLPYIFMEWANTAEECSDLAETLTENGYTPW